MINMRNALMTDGERLPYDAEVEYLFSLNGGKYINTGVKIGTSNIGFVVDFSMIPWIDPNEPEEFACVCGVDMQEWAAYAIVGLDPNNNVVLDGSFGDYLAEPVTQQDLINHRFRASFNYLSDGGMWKLYDLTSGDSWSTGRSWGWTAIQNPLYLFAGSRDSGPAMFSQSKIYSVKISDGNVLVRDFIPVRRTLDGVSVGEMYDLVSGTFAERHGTFQYGSDKSAPNAVGEVA